MLGIIQAGKCRNASRVIDAAHQPPGGTVAVSFWLEPPQNPTQDPATNPAPSPATQSTGWHSGNASTRARDLKQRKAALRWLLPRRHDDALGTAGFERRGKMRTEVLATASVCRRSGRHEFVRFSPLKQRCRRRAEDPLIGEFHACGAENLGMASQTSSR